MPITVTSRHLAVVAIVLAAIAGTYAVTRSHPAAAAPVSDGATASSATQHNTAGVSVSGTGRITGTPNLLRLDMAVQVTKPTVVDALASANAAAAAVQKSLRDHGVAKADLQTSGLSVQPDYTYSDNTPRLTGYVVSEQLSAVLRNLDTAGAAIGAAANAGGSATRINGASLDIDGDTALVAAARQRAFDDAKAKAEQYANAADRRLGPVTSISEQVTPNPQPAYPFAARMAAADASAVPIQAGSQDVTVNVDVVWSLAP